MRILISYSEMIFGTDDMALIDWTWRSLCLSWPSLSFSLSVYVGSQKAGEGSHSETLMIIELRMIIDVQRSQIETLMIIGVQMYQSETPMTIKLQMKMKPLPFHSARAPTQRTHLHTHTHTHVHMQVS